MELRVMHGRVVAVSENSGRFSVHVDSENRDLEIASYVYTSLPKGAPMIGASVEVLLDKNDAAVRVRRVK